MKPSKTFFLYTHRLACLRVIMRIFFRVVIANRRQTNCASRKHNTTEKNSMMYIITYFTFPVSYILYPTKHKKRDEKSWTEEKSKKNLVKKQVWNEFSPAKEVLLCTLTSVSFQLVVMLKKEKSEEKKKKKKVFHDHRNTRVDVARNFIPT